MSYFTIENEELTFVKTENLPQELEELYQEIRKKYIIEYFRSDWSSDSGDSGMGYDYDNSYEIFREPQRKEMVIKNGELVGFYVGFSDNIQLETKATKEYFLKLEQGACIYKGGASSARYGDSKKWTLKIKEDPSPLEYVCLMWVSKEDREHIFEPDEFNCKFIESVYNQHKWQDSYGYFDGAFRVILKLTKEGAENPDALLQELEKFRPVLVK